VGYGFGGKGFINSLIIILFILFCILEMLFFLRNRRDFIFYSLKVDAFFIDVFQVYSGDPLSLKQSNQNFGLGECFFN